jgi:hypothetical protein
LLAGLPFLPMGAGPGTSISLRFRPEATAKRIAVQTDGGRLMFNGEGSGGWAPIELPSPQIIMSGRLSLIGREMLVVSFRGSPFLDLLAVIGWDDAQMRILAIEPETVRAPEGTALSTRLAASGEEPFLRVTSALSDPRGQTLPFHLQWMDMLSFRSRLPLTEVAMRPPLAGSCQARLASVRGFVTSMLALHPTAVTWADLAETGLLEVPHQLALATGSAAYPTDMADP